MKRLLTAVTCAALALSSAAFAQTGQGSGQTKGMNDDMSKGGSMSKDGMSKDGMSKDGMSNSGMSKDGNMSKEGMSKDGMKKDNMSK